MVSAFIKGNRPTITLDYESKYLKMVLKILEEGRFIVEMGKVLPIL